MKTIGVFFGSRSPEHDISIITGQLIIAGLKEIGVWRVVPVYLSKQGTWYADDRLGLLEFFRSPNFDEKLKGIPPCMLDLDVAKEKLVFRTSSGFARKEISIDIAFPAFHGQNGEDGTAQGLFELANVPYVGCGTAPSAITMDKVLTKLLYERFKIPTTSFVYFAKSDWNGKRTEILNDINAKLAWPLFVKPARLGSSIGIAKAKTPQELEFAIEVALRYDDKVIVENGVENVMDVTCCVIGNNEPRPSVLQESSFEGSHFSYEDKYIKGGQIGGGAQQSIFIPARLDEKKTEEIRALACRVYSLFECSGIARVDFLYDKSSGAVFANEINTLPGTLYHHLWDKSGLKFPELLKELVRLAEERHAAEKDLTSVFRSNVLQEVRGAKFKFKKTTKG